jgi:ABC-2 type transport system ATP-binding protein
MIEVEDLTKYYGGKKAISGLSFRIEKGEIVGFLGLNGAGKTTTLRILGCLIIPSSGNVWIDGLDIATDAHEVRRRLGFLPDTPPLYEEMSVRSYLQFVAELKGLPADTARRRVEEVIETCGLTEARDQTIGTLSHGYKQRTGIAQAVVHRPSLLILDEPTGGLDPVQIVEMRELIKRLGGEHTILLSSHNLHEISQTCDRLLVLDEGRIIADGTEASLTQKFSDGGEAGVLELEVEAPEGASAEQAGEKAQAVVGKVQGVLSSRVVSVMGRRVALEVEFNTDRRPAVARAIVESGLGLLRLDRKSLELESVFKRLTQREARLS